MEADTEKVLTKIISGSKVRTRLRPALTGGRMSWEIVSGLIAFFVFWVLAYALLKPKKFR